MDSRTEFMVEVYKMDKLLNKRKYKRKAKISNDVIFDAVVTPKK